MSELPLYSGRTDALPGEDCVQLPQKGSPVRAIVAYCVATCRCRSQFQNTSKVDASNPLAWQSHTASCQLPEISNSLD